VSSLSTAYVILYNSQNEVSTRECVGEKNRGSLMLKTEGYWKIVTCASVFRVKQYPVLEFKYHRQAGCPKVFSNILQFLQKNSG